MSSAKLDYNLILQKEKEVRKERLKRAWFRFKKSKLAITGLIILSALLVMAVFAEYITPYPEHSGTYVNFKDRFQPISIEHLLGTDHLGRDIFTRVVFGFRLAFIMIGIVISIVMPVGTVLGLIAGYYKAKWPEHVILRFADMFVSIPPLILALSICAILEPNIVNAMIAVTLMWWPWYTRMVYSMTSSIRDEPYVWAARALGVRDRDIMFKEILPNILGPILTKGTLDAAWVILIGAAISFLGLGAQPPTPDLGTMISEYMVYFPSYWWMITGPATGIAVLVMAFNLFGDGLREVFAGE
ncbi:MAG: ABC transporter permease [Nitrososphaerota archaeon]|nr:ABC transporter permease [Aigarchaeota archaeon]MDW8076530.1 ABC transporter permease [Nitrososphaerota archaeon]